MKTKFRPYAYLYHAESDCFIKVYSEQELEEVFSTGDGGLCSIMKYASYRKWRIQDDKLAKAYNER